MAPLFATLDTEPLTTTPSAGQWREFRSSLGPAVTVSGKTVPRGALIFIAIAGGLFLLFFTTIFSLLLSWVNLGWVPWVLVPSLVAIGIALAVRAARRRSRGMYQVAQFAKANDLEFIPEVANPPFPGRLFGRGRHRAATSVVRLTQPRVVEFGNYQFTTGDDGRSSIHNAGYVAIQVDASLPSIVLDTRADDSWLDNISGVDKDQRVRLEGNFNDTFTLYAPEGYEADALYLFTPDVMAIVMDLAPDMDIELSDGWVFVYSKKDISVPDPQLWRRLTTLVNTLDTKFGQWERWRDDRLAHPENLPAAAATVVPEAPRGVAPEGRKLRSGLRWLGIAFVVGVLAFIAVNFVIIQLMGSWATGGGR